MTHKLKNDNEFGERSITDEEIVVAAEKNQELSFHAQGPRKQKDEQAEDSRHIQEQSDPIVTTRRHESPKFTEELKKTCSLAAEASFEIANFDALMAM